MKTKRCNDRLREMTHYRWRVCWLVAVIAVTGLCNPGVTNAATSAKTTRRGAGNEEVVPLNFVLADAYGREVRASDYRGLPLLIMVGACW